MRAFAFDYGTPIQPSPVEEEGSDSDPHPLPQPPEADQPSAEAGEGKNLPFTFLLLPFLTFPPHFLHQFAILMSEAFAALIHRQLGA